MSMGKTDTNWRIVWTWMKEKGMVVFWWGGPSIRFEGNRIKCYY